MTNNADKIPASLVLKCQSNLPDGWHISRFYRAFEGDIRMIATDNKGEEHRLTLIFNERGDLVSLRQW